MNKPSTISLFESKVRETLIANGLQELCDSLDDRGKIKSKLEEKFKAFDRAQIDIPEELDWIYAQYNSVTIFS